MVQPGQRRSFLEAVAAAAAGLAAKTREAGSERPAGLTLEQAGRLLRSREVSPVDLTQACLTRLDRYNPALNAFITVTAEQALAEARAMEAEQARGVWRGPLHGIPIALKDNIDTAGVHTTAASELFSDRVPSEDAEIVRRLKEAGAILLGKLNLHEFACGGTSDVSFFGPVHNPWALDRIAGGSSGGSAAAVAADLCFAALGTDSLGSIRIPASYCGVAGFKPTYGRVSLRGVIPLSNSLDHVGPIAKTVEDCALVLGAIAGYDALDPTTADAPVPDYSLAFQMPASALRLGIPRSPYFHGLDPEVAETMETAIAVLQKQTGSVAEVQLPNPADVFTIASAEAYAYHAAWLAESADEYQPATRRRLLGAANLKPERYEAALRQMNAQRREIRNVFSDVDVLVMPTMRGTAESFAESRNFDPIGVRNTSPFDVFGLPSMTVPCGFSAAGMPIGLQISGAPFAESTVLALAHAYERETAWHTRRPKLMTA